MSNKDITQEIEDMAGNLEKSAKTEKEVLFDTIKELGPEGLRKALPTLNKEEQELLKETLQEMKKAVSMDDAYAAKVIQGKIDDTKLQEEIASDDADEKLVKPEAAKHNAQGTPTEGWEGQVIKAKGDMSKDEAKSKLMAMEEKEHGVKDPKKLVEAEKEEQDEKKKKGMEKAHVGFKAVEANARKHGADDPAAVAAAVGRKKYGKEGMAELAAAGRKGEGMKKGMCKCGEPSMEGLRKCKGCMKEMKKAIELELGDKSTPELVKAEMKSRLLAEESQLGDAPEMNESTRANKEDVKPLDLGEDNKKAQKEVNDLSQGQNGEMKKAVWSGENDLLKARTGGRNHHFSVNGYYDEVLKDNLTPTKDEKLAKSEPTDKKEDLNDIIAKGGDATWGQLETDRLVKANEAKVSGKFVKSFVDADIAEAFGMTQEEVKKILGEE